MNPNDIGYAVAEPDPAQAGSWQIITTTMPSLQFARSWIDAGCPSDANDPWFAT
jgi:hypothetical protein